jgi:beta-phosphoglucomutase-like phosphatase (HAD superfamily)
MPIDAVIFDMDGVIIDSEDQWLEARIEFAQAHGKQWTSEDQRAVMGRSTEDWARIMHQRLQIDLSVEEVMREVKARILARLEANLIVLPGALEAIRLVAGQYPVGLASGSTTENIRAMLRLTGMQDVFQVVVTGDEIARGKPHPDIYLEAATRLNIEPARCLGIEDSANGIRSLHAAGMKIIAVPSPNYPLAPDVLALADVHLPSLEAFSLELVGTLSASRKS